MTDYKLFKIRKARETGKIEYLDNILLEEIEDLQERKKKIQARLEQFYPELKVQNEDSTSAFMQNSSMSAKCPISQRRTWS